MKRVLNRLGIVGLIIAIVIWGCVVLMLTGPFVGRVLPGLFVAFPASPLAALNCPLALSNGEIKSITTTIANMESTEQTYLLTMVQPAMGSGGGTGGTELCHQEITVEPGSKKAAYCLVRLRDLDRYSSVQASWYISVRAVAPANADYFDVDNVFSGSCIIRNESGFWSDLGYSGGATLTALAIILWGAFLWPKGKWADRALIFLFSIVVYSLAWLLNATIWLGLSNLHLYFLILGGMLLVMFMILWSMG